MARKKPTQSKLSDYKIFFEELPLHPTNLAPALINARAKRNSTSQNNQK